jgi:hypothetical protein
MLNKETGRSSLSPELRVATKSRSSFHSPLHYEREMGRTLARPSLLETIDLPHTNLPAAAADLWNVELANSKVLTVGVPSITFDRVFNTSGYAVRL